MQRVVKLMIYSIMSDRPCQIKHHYTMWGGKAHDGPREGAYFVEMENTTKIKNNSMKKKTFIYYNCSNERQAATMH